MEREKRIGKRTAGGGEGQFGRIRKRQKVKRKSIGVKNRGKRKKRELRSKKEEENK